MSEGDSPSLTLPDCYTVCLDTDVTCIGCRMPLPAPPLEDAPPVAAFLSRPMRWICGIFLVLLSGFLTICAGGLALEGGETEKKGPTKMTAADLLKLQSLKELPDNWVSYKFPTAIATAYEIVAMRPGNNKKGRFIFVQVQDRWLLAYVPPDFTGNVLEGELETWDSPMSRDIMRKLHAGYPAQTKAMLPYLINCEYGRAAHYRPKYIFAALAGIGALVCFWKGIRMPWVQSATAAEKADVLRVVAAKQRRAA